MARASRSVVSPISMRDDAPGGERHHAAHSSDEPQQIGGAGACSDAAASSRSRGGALRLLQRMTRIEQPLHRSSRRASAAAS